MPYGDEPELAFSYERQCKLADLVTGEGTKIDYTYDFGDSWDHEILVERALTAAAGQRYPTCLVREGACPPEDCGGTGGYERLREILDPAGFDLATTDEGLRRIGR